MATADEYGFTRQDRLDLAEYLLRRDVRSWKDLTEGQLSRILDAMDGYHLITELVTSGRGQGVVLDRSSA